MANHYRTHLHRRRGCHLHAVRIGLARRHQPQRRSALGHLGWSEHSLRRWPVGWRLRHRGRGLPARHGALPAHLARRGRDRLPRLHHRLCRIRMGAWAALEFLAPDLHVEPRFGALRSGVVHHALHHGAGAGVFAGAHRKAALAKDAPDAAHLAAPRAHRPGADRRAALVAAPVVPGRPVHHLQGQGISALVQPVPDDPVLSLRPARRIGHGDHRHVPLHALTQRETRPQAAR